MFYEIFFELKAYLVSSKLEGSGLGAVVKNYRTMLLNLSTAEIKLKSPNGWD
jgi:hypothetical protein